MNHTLYTVHCVSGSTEEIREILEQVAKARKPQAAATAAEAVRIAVEDKKTNTTD